MRICRTCKIEKKDSSFYKNKMYADGVDTQCKICTSLYAKKYREKKPNKQPERKTKRNMLLTGLRKEDWCNTYEFLLDLGYDPEGDIHKQFTEKYGLTYKKRPITNKVISEYAECLDTTDETDSLTD